METSAVFLYSQNQKIKVCHRNVLSFTADAKSEMQSFKCLGVKVGLIQDTAAAAAAATGTQTVGWQSSVYVLLLSHAACFLY